MKGLFLGAMITVAAAGAGFAGSMDQARQYEHHMQKAAALRQEAEHLRSEAAAKGNVGAARTQAKALDAKADALEQKARSAEAADWPPAE